MSGQILRPSRLQINAWSGQISNTDENSQYVSKPPWGQVEQASSDPKWLSAPEPADLRDWQHPDVGWGLVMPDDKTLAPDVLARGEDAPEPIRRLLKSRPGSPVLRWREGLNFLRRYYPGGKSAQDLSIVGSKPGIADGHIPRYLLIYASPRSIPWRVQYTLNQSAFVGRIDLDGLALDHYIEALISNWGEQSCNVAAPLIWSVDHGEQDITWLMARAIGSELWSKFEHDADLTGRRFLFNRDATCVRLLESLTEMSPGLIVTTSHGLTGPLDERLKTQLGMPVDADFNPLRLQYLANWKPSGAIWYSHACCSAGADGTSRYSGLLVPESPISQTLNGVAANAGAMVAPLARALLGMPSPLRAFVGHVEPTFDWTLRDPQTLQVLTNALTTALYEGQFQARHRTPIGFALQSLYRQAGTYFGIWREAIDNINRNTPGARDLALFNNLVGTDLQSTVIIGDPTVSLPALH